MSDAVLAKIVCRQCYAVLDAPDNFCRHCGTPTSGLSSAPGGRSAPALKWSESPWVVLPMLFLVIGPLALPLLWRSRQFTRPWKIVLTLLVTAVTVFLIWRIWVAVDQAMGSLLEIERTGRF
jgi:hypothetical protein